MADFDPTRPLAGIRIIECSMLGPAGVTGPFADMGADVIKIEPPNGDYARNMTWPIVEGTSLLFLHSNRGKSSVVLDLRTPEGVEVFLDLVRGADAVVEAMRPGGLERRGLGFEKLLDSEVAIFRIGATAFILGQHYQEDWAGNFMMQLMVDDLDAWWTYIQSLDLPGKFGVRAPTPPEMQPWGIRISYVVDPAGILWHVAQRRQGFRRAADGVDAVAAGRADRHRLTHFGNLQREFLCWQRATGDGHARRAFSKTVSGHVQRVRARRQRQRELTALIADRGGC